MSQSKLADRVQVPPGPPHHVEILRIPGKCYYNIMFHFFYVNEKIIFDADLTPLKDKVVSVIGSGNQGQVQAHILRE